MKVFRPVEIVQVMTALILLLSCSSVSGALPSIELPVGVKEVHRFRGDLYRGFPDEIYVNRNGELATILGISPHGSGSSDDIVLLLSETRGKFEYDFGTDDRILGLSFSNWGVAVEADPINPGFQTVYAIPFGQSPESLYASYIGNVFMNDDGVVAFSSRASNSHGMRDLWKRYPNQSIVSLPDLGEDELRGALLVDSDDRVLQAHWIDGQIPLDSDMFRHDSDSGWEDLTMAFGDVGERPLEIVPQSTVNSSGDFVFSSYFADNLRLNLFSGTDRSIVRIYERTYETGTSVENLKLADNGFALIRIAVAGTLTRDIFLYRPDDGLVTPFSDYIPNGSTLSGYPYMNNNGDIVFVSRDAISGLYTAQILQADSSAATPIAWLADSPLQFRDIVITDEIDPYFWLRLENEQWVLGTMISEPSVSILLLTALVGSITLRFTRWV